MDDRGRALVTGASSGIGAATVRALCEAGFEVHAAARRADRLDALAAETGCVAYTLDVNDREAVVELGASVPVDLLVNNAGLGRAMGDFLNASVDDLERTINTNVTSALHMAQVVLPGMIQRKRGHIVNIGSVAGLNAVASTLYGATKSAIHMFTRDLRLELHGTGVRVTEICPGRVTTEFYDVAVDDPNERADHTGHGGEELHPSDIAEAIVYAATAPERVNVSLLEIFPTEQTYGGSTFTPVDRS
ncbi:MAG: SDR family oxidoreductase [Acidimicrobiales bacterium]